MNTETRTSETAGFTPGPWGTDDRFWTDDTYLVWGPDDKPVAEAVFRSFSIGEDEDGGRAAALANARLIAASPAIYESLRVIVGRLEIANAEGDSIASALLPDAKAAIAQAEGGDS